MLDMNTNPERGQSCLNPLFKEKGMLSGPKRACLRTRGCNVQIFVLTLSSLSSFPFISSHFPFPFPIPHCALSITYSYCPLSILHSRHVQMEHVGFICLIYSFNVAGILFFANLNYHAFSNSLEMTLHSLIETLPSKQIIFVARIPVKSSTNARRQFSTELCSHGQ